MIYSAFLPLRLCGILVAALCLSLFGCSGNVPSNSPLAGGHLRGNVHGGQQPVSGASLQLYAASRTDYGQAATPLLVSPVVTDANGNFSITGDYTCPSSTSQLYIVATGGNPGLAPGTNNPAMALMSALGPCDRFGSQYTLDPNSFIWINEVTTVASVYAMAGFMSGDATHLGTSITNAAGLANSFGLVNNLVDPTSGTALTTTFAGNGTAPQAALNTLGNVLSSCVNSNGTGPQCSTLFAAATPSGGTAPTDTIQAIYNIARHPANNVSALYGLVTATAPFQPMLASAPNDWNLQLIYRPVTGSTGTTQTAIAIDALGNAWIANEFTTSSNSASSVSELSNNGSILSGAAGYTGGGLNRPTGIAIDPSGNAWIMNSTNPSLTKLSSTGSPLSGTTGFASPLSRGLAIDGSGNVWCGSRLAKFDNNGNNLSGSGYTGGGVGGTNSVGGIAIDAAGSAWLAVVTGFDTSTVAKFSSIGVALSPASGYTTDGLSEAWSVAIDNAGNAWVTNNGPPTLASVFKLAHDGTMLSGSGGFTGGGIENPLGVAIDGAGNVWVTSDKVVTVNGTTTSLNSLVELDNSGTILSGATGYALPAGFSVGVAVDASGNVWAAMASNYVIEMVGVATPVVTPLSVGVKNNTLGARP